MKRFFRYPLLGLLATYTLGVVADRVSGRSFLSSRTPFQFNSPERLSMQHHQMYLYDEPRRNWLDVTVFGGQSTNACDLAEYFFPFRKTKLVVGELNSKAALDGTVDIIANYLNIFTGPLYADGQPYDFNTDPLQNYTFQSEITIKPKQEFVGVGFHYRFYFCDNPEKGFWLDAATS